MIDRVWWVWQDLDLKNREKALAGGMGDTAAKNATLSDALVMGPHVGRAFLLHLRVEPLDTAEKYYGEQEIGVDALCRRREVIVIFSQEAMEA
ncbi:hypothetical protein N0V95_009252 [Ascochyta clinopodiicola]|nr:hypothetical protein N0V95_009252 [Ascochyta clinopodiicola]